MFTSLRWATAVSSSSDSVKAAAIAQPADGEEAATAGAAVSSEEAAKTNVAAVRKRRKLYRQLTGSEVPWFPHDNDIDLMKELCHEARRPRWVYFGTPAGGAGIHGCIEMGCSVMALCFNEHHRKHLGPFLVQRAVEAMLGSNSQVFQNDVLAARAKQLQLTTKEDEKKEAAIRVERVDGYLDDMKQALYDKVVNNDVFNFSTAV